MPIVFSKGPTVQVTLEFQEQKLKQATLSFADKFQCDILGSVGKNLKDQLLAFLESYGNKAPLLMQLPLEGLTPFRQNVLCHLQRVPFGEIVTYGELAEAAGYPRAARAVGSACHFNPFPLFIPCHRVVASQGRLGGFAYDLEMKKRLLDFEV
jgi:O-6-methylguanine DNA methyltransferase